MGIVSGCRASPMPELGAPLSSGNSPISEAPCHISTTARGDRLPRRGERGFLPAHDAPLTRPASAVAKRPRRCASRAGGTLAWFACGVRSSREGSAFIVIPTRGSLHSSLLSHEIPVAFRCHKTIASRPCTGRLLENALLEAARRCHARCRVLARRGVHRGDQRLGRLKREWQRQFVERQRQLGQRHELDAKPWPAQFAVRGHSHRSPA